MEEPNEEWEIKEYAISESNLRGKVSWILNKGLGFGKKVLVTGILISSAPLVLPPLLIVSAIGVAVSVPSGIFLASYASTEKLMSKLLPRPAPLLLEYGPEEGEDEWLGENIDTRREEEEEKEDIKVGVETRTELLEKENNEIEAWKAKEEEEEDHVQEGAKMKAQEKIKGFDDIETVEKKNDKTGGGKTSGDYGGEDVKMKEREEVGDNVDVIELLDKEYNEKEGTKVMEGDGYGQEGVKRNAQDEEIGDVDVIVEKNGYEEDGGEYLDVEEETSLKQIDGTQIEGDGEVHGIVLGLIESDEESGDATIEVTSIVMDKKGGQASVNDIEQEEIVKETRGLLERIRDETKDENPAQKETQGAEETGDQRVITIGPEDIEIPVEAKIVDSDIGLVKEENIADVNPKIEEKEIVVLSNADAREVGDKIEFDDKNIASGQNPYAVYKTSHVWTDHEFVKLSTYIGGDPEEVVEHPVSRRTDGSKDAGIFSEKEVSMPSNEKKEKKERKKKLAKKLNASEYIRWSEVLYNEEKIWEQIDAMRSIVGYKVTPQKTCIEELKALYIITGVEPPASFKHPSDLTEVNNKLCFLMSIIGLK